MNTATAVATAATTNHSVSSAEWQTRCDLAALYRLLAHFRMTDVIYTHISARVPGEHDSFLINRYGVLFEAMRASDLVRIDLDGNILEEGVQSNAVNRAGFTIHSAVHQARPDVQYVIHSHTQAGIAVSAQAAGLLPISQHALWFQDALSYHEYEGLAIDLGERERLVVDLGDNNAMILRNHGLLTAGETAGEAFIHMYYLERACQIQIAALTGGGALHFPSDAVIQKTGQQWRKQRTNRAAHAQRFWQACLSMIEHQQSDWQS